MPEPEEYNHLQTPADVKNNSKTSEIPASVRHQFEAQFGADFSKVRVHEGHATTLRGGAESFANGESIYFAPGRYDPHSQEGRELLGHELTHVVQQRSARCGPATMVQGASYDGK